MAILVVLYDNTTGGFKVQRIGSAQISDGAITSGKLASGIVGTVHLRDLNVTSAKLATAIIGLLGTVADEAITSAKIASGAIGGVHVFSGSIPGLDLENQAITSAKIGALAVGAPHIAALAIVSGKVASGGLSPLTSGKIWAGYTGNIAREENKPAGGATVATGTYSGNGADDRQITTGFKCSLVLLFWEDYKRMWMVYTTGGFRAYFAATSTLTKDPTDLTLHASDGFVVDAASANSDATAYSWWAISE